MERRPNTALKRERLCRSWTQEQAADALYQFCVNEARERGDINAKMISRWETGENAPSLFYQQKLCKLFGKTPEELAFLVDDDERDIKKQDTARTNIHNVHGIHADQDMQEPTQAEQLGLLKSGNETSQTNTTEDEKDMDANKRNSIQKIGTIVGSSILANYAFGLQPFSLAQRGIKLHDEEVLTICEGRNYFICRSPLLIDFARLRARTLIIR